MDLEYLKDELTRRGWTDLQPGTHEGIKFDLIGSRGKALARWSVLVRVLQKADEATMTIWRAHFNEVSKRSKGVLIGKYFVLCLICEEVDNPVLDMISKDSFGLLGLFRGKEGGGNIFIVDVGEKRVHGKVPFRFFDAIQTLPQGIYDALTRTLERTNL